MPDRNSPSPDIAPFGRQLAHYSLDPVFVTKLSGEILYANPAACKLLGYSLPEFTQGGRDLITDPDDPELMSLIEQSRETGHARGEQWIYDKQGTPIRVELSSAAFDAEGGERYSIIIARDISWQRRQAYEHRLLEVAASVAPLVVCIADEEWRILWINPAGEAISGYPASELIGSVAPLGQYLQESMPHSLAAIKQEMQSSGKWTGQVYARRKNGEVYPLYGTIALVDTEDAGQRHVVAALADVSELQAFESRLKRLSQYDPVTGLPNRGLFAQKAGVILSYADRDESPVYLCLIDIDGFGDINGALGYDAGDAVLKRAAERLSEVVDNRAILSRHTGGSFALLLAGVKDLRSLEALIERLKSAIRTSMRLDGGRLSLTASVGIASCPQDGADEKDLLHKAGMALRQIKREGGDGHAFYTPDFDGAGQKFVTLAAPMREGLENEEFMTYFQPIVDTRSRRVVGMEALARWRRADGTFISPADFIPVAERTGMIRMISLLVLQQTCRHLKRLDAAGHTGLSASVNLSVREFRHAGLVDRILSTIAEADLEPGRIILEITENHLMHRPDEINRVLTVLQRKGMKVVIDDFGTGYSSFSYLRRFSVNGIKLDRFFIRDIPGDEKNETLLSMMISIGLKLDIPVVAEGVETREQLAFLEKHGCSRFQGFLVSPAVDSDGFVKLLDESAVEMR